MRAATSRALSLIVAVLVVGCGGGPTASHASSASAPEPSPSAIPSASPIDTATLAAPSPSPDPTATAAASSSGPPQTEWTLNLYRKAGMRFQYPDYYACTATSVQIALNFIAMDGGLTNWTVSTSYATQEAIFKFERANMTMATSSEGSDPHGTRNAINFYGWGAMTAGVYDDVEFSSFSAAAKGVVSSVARTRRPAIIFPWLGGHSQVVTGFKVHGENPATSNNFTVLGVFLTDPLLGYSYINAGGANTKVTAINPDTYVTLANWKSGRDAIKYTDFEQLDSRQRDPIDGKIGRNEWYRKWVAVLAV